MEGMTRMNHTVNISFAQFLAHKEAPAGFTVFGDLELSPTSAVRR
jgi:hypothetical protein